MIRILVPVDFSKTSLNALTYAIRLFEDSSHEFTILHTYGVMSSSAFTMKIESIKRIMKQDAEEEMDNLIKRIQEEEPNISINSKLINSSASSTIISLGDSGEYDFIVMGTKGASGLKEVFIGSVTGSVISRTKAAVVVVPDNYVYQPLDEIVFGMSDDLISNGMVVKPLRSMVWAHACKIKILHIGDDYKPELEELIAPIKDLSPSVTYVPSYGNINQSLNKYLKENNACMLCLVRSKRGIFNRIFSESVTLNQTFHTTVPLLILHD